MINKVRGNQIIQIATMSFIVAILLFSYYIITNHGTLYMNGDGFQQQLAFYLDGYDQVHTSGIFSWTWKHFLGNDYYTSTSFYTGFSPYFWFVMIFPKTVLPQAMLFANMLKVTFSSVFMALFLRKIGVKKTSALFIGSILYATSGPFVINFYFQHFADFFSLVPLIFLAIEYFLDGKWKYLPLATFLLAIVNPYFMSSFIIVLGMYSLMRILMQDDVNFKRRAMQFVSINLLLLLGLIMSSFVFMPSIMKYVDSGRSGGSKDFIITTLTNVTTSLYTFFQIFIAIIFPPTLIKTTELVQDTGFIREGIATYAWQSLAFYTGSITLLVGSQITRMVSRKKVILGTIFALIMLIILSVPILNSALNGFGNVTFRIGYVISFMLAVITAIVIEKIDQLSLKRFILSSVIVILLTAGVPFIVYIQSYLLARNGKVGFIQLDDKFTNSDFTMFLWKNLLPTMIITVILIAVIIYYVRKDSKKFQSINKVTKTRRQKQNKDLEWNVALITVFHAVIIFNVFIQFGWGPLIISVASYQNVESSVKKNIEYTKFKQINNISDFDRFRVDRSIYGEEDWWQNYGLAYNLNSPTTYQSLYNRSTNEYYNWANITYGNYDTWVRGYNTTIQSTNLLNIKYYLTYNDENVPANFKKAHHTNYGDVYVNTLSNSFVKQYNYYITPQEMTDAALLYRNDIFSKAIVVDKITAEALGMQHYENNYPSHVLTKQDLLSEDGLYSTYKIPFDEQGEVLFTKNDQVEVYKYDKVTKQETQFNTTVECNENLGNLCNFYAISKGENEEIHVRMKEKTPTLSDFSYQLNSLVDLSAQAQKTTINRIHESTSKTKFTAQFNKSDITSKMLFLPIPYKGWSATLNGEAAEITNVDGGFIGIKATNLLDENILELHFTSPGFYLGVEASLLGLGLFAMSIAAEIVIKRYQR